MAIRIYAGSLRPGGGLSVAKVMIEAIAEHSSAPIVVYTGARDASDALQDIFHRFSHVTEKRFFPGSNSEMRYLLSKLLFPLISLFDLKGLLISINYYIPVFCREMVYHINLLSFKRFGITPVGMKIKEMDAAIACRLATVNVFESDYLLRIAEEKTQHPVRNPKRLYIGVDQDFYRDVENTAVYDSSHLLVVSSIQPHKDNSLCIELMHHLCLHHPHVDWQMTFAGGQSVAQWENLRKLAIEKEVGSRVQFVGPLGKKNLSDLMAESLCLVNPSRVESFCMVAIEAMASGCPVIVTSETSMPESVGDAALVVEAGSVSQFSEAVLKLRNDIHSRSRLISKGRQRADTFSKESFKKNLLEIINEL